MCYILGSIIINDPSKRRLKQPPLSASQIMGAVFLLNDIIDAILTSIIEGISWLKTSNPL